MYGLVLKPKPLKPHQAISKIIVDSNKLLLLVLRTYITLFKSITMFYGTNNIPQNILHPGPSMENIL